MRIFEINQTKFDVKEKEKKKKEKITRVINKYFIEMCECKLKNCMT